jgi:hypothetical protein
MFENNVYCSHRVFQNKIHSCTGCLRIIAIIGTHFMETNLITAEVVPEPSSLLNENKSATRASGRDGNEVS